MENIGILDAGVIALLGYAVVFFGLILLMIVITIMGKFFTAKANKPEKVETAAPAAAPVAAASAAPVAAPATGKAILFSRVTCRNCRVAENLLGKAGLAYEKLIADENIDLCKAYGVKGAPTLVITDGEQFESHYSVQEIKKYLASC